MFYLAVDLVSLHEKRKLEILQKSDLTACNTAILVISFHLHLHFSIWPFFIPAGVIPVVNL